jgi:hypothetical protein
VAVLLSTLLDLLVRGFLGPEWSLFLGGPVVAPVVEETAKGAALLLIAWRLGQEFDDAVDGVVYGGLVGLGFATSENVLYFGRAFLGGGAAAVGIAFLVRVVAAGFAHSMFTGMAGAGLGLALERRDGRRWPIAVAGYGVGVGLHGLWNLVAVLGAVKGHVFVALGVDVAVLLLPGVWTLLAVVHFAWRRERRAVAEGLAEEVATGVVLAGEVAILTSRRARRGALWRALARHGPLAWYALRQLYDAEIELAFRKWRQARGAHASTPAPASSLTPPRETIARLRARLRDLGAAAIVTEGPEP